MPKPKRRIDLGDDRDWRAELDRLAAKLQRIRLLLEGDARVVRYRRRGHHVKAYDVRPHWILRIKEKKK